MMNDLEAQAQWDDLNIAINTTFDALKRLRAVEDSIRSAFTKASRAGVSFDADGQIVRPIAALRSRIQAERVRLSDRCRDGREAA